MGESKWFLIAIHYKGATMNLRKDTPEHSMRDITLTLLRSGQKGSYKDSVSEYDVKSELGAKLTEKLLVKHVTKTTNKVASISHFNGTSGFPFGLDKFYGFWLTKDDNRFKLKICYPYCD